LITQYVANLVDAKLILLTKKNTNNGNKIGYLVTNVNTEKR